MPPEHVDPRWRDAMDLLGAESAQVYRATVHDDAEFYEFFRQLTPIDVIDRMQIGSRPTSRSERTGIAALRSIPWWHCLVAMSLHDAGLVRRRQCAGPGAPRAGR